MTIIQLETKLLIFCIGSLRSTNLVIESDVAIQRIGQLLDESQGDLSGAAL